MGQDSDFLNLPGELRNRIYEHVFADITILRINKHGFLVPPAINTVCRQINEEVQNTGFLGHSLAARPSIQCHEAQVLNADFSHIVKFFGELAQHGVNKVDTLRINWQLTGDVLDQCAIHQWCDHFTMEKTRSSPARPRETIYKINVGNYTWKPVKISYNVNIMHNFRADELCACGEIARQISFENVIIGGNRYYVLPDLARAICDSHTDAKKMREMAEVDLRRRQAKVDLRSSGSYKSWGRCAAYSRTRCGRS